MADSSTLAAKLLMNATFRGFDYNLSGFRIWFEGAGDSGAPAVVFLDALSRIDVEGLPLSASEAEQDQALVQLLVWARYESSRVTDVAIAGSTLIVSFEGRRFSLRGGDPGVETAWLLQGGPPGGDGVAVGCSFGEVVSRGGPGS